MNTEKLELIMLEGEKEKRWGVKLADGSNFYKLLFRYEKLEKIEYEEHIRSMFASYTNWRSQIEKLVAECRNGGTEEDNKAIEYAEVLNKDILDHIHHILMEVACDPPSTLEDLNKYAEEIIKKKQSN